MTLAWHVLLALAQQCAPLVHWETTTAIVQVETAGHVYAVHDNTTRESFRPANADAAVRLAKARIDKGHSVDLGLAQINSRNLGWLGLSLTDAFDACKNLRASQTVLHSNYRLALESGYAAGQPALQAALSAYNTGSLTRGRVYVQRVLAAARSPFPVQPFLKS